MGFSANGATNAPHQHQPLLQDIKDMKKKKSQRWARLDGDDGWQIIIPDFDSKPHATKHITKNRMELAWLDCPCKPKVALEDKIITHNSFIDMEAIEKSLKRIGI